MLLQFCNKKVDFATMEDLENGKQPGGTKEEASVSKPLSLLTQTRRQKASPELGYSLTVLHNSGNKVCFHLSLKRSYEFWFYPKL